MVLLAWRLGSFPAVCTQRRRSIYVFLLARRSTVRHTCVGIAPRSSASLDEVWHSFWYSAPEYEGERLWLSQQPASLKRHPRLFGINVSTRTQLRMRIPHMTTREKNAQTRSRTLQSELSMTRGHFLWSWLRGAAEARFMRDKLGLEQPWCMSTWVLESKASTICVLQQWKSSI